MPKLGAGRASLLTVLARRDVGPGGIARSVATLPQSLERLRCTDSANAPAAEQTAIETSFAALGPVPVEDERDLEVVRKHGTHGESILGVF